MAQNTYNGWTNRETWIVNVWFNPESKEDVEYAKEALEEQYDNILDGPLKDMIDINAINWDELMEEFEDEEDTDEDDAEDDTNEDDE